MDSTGSGRGRRKKRLGDLLQDAGVVTEEQIQEALRVQKENNYSQKLGLTLVDLGFTTDDDIAQALSFQLNLPRIHLGDFHIEEAVLSLVDEKMLRKYMLIPYEFSEKNVNILRVAMSDPMDMLAMDDLSIVTGLQIEVGVTTVKDVAAALDRYYGNAEAMKVADQFTKEHQERYGNLVWRRIRDSIWNRIISS